MFLPPCQDESEVPQLSSDSEEYVVELLLQCEQKLQLLQEELEGRDLGAILKELDDEEVRARGPSGSRDRVDWWTHLGSPNR